LVRENSELGNRSGMALVDEFVELFGVWEEARPYLSMIVDEDEMRLVVAMRDHAVTVDEAAELLGLPAEDATDLLLRAYSRCIVDKHKDEVAGGHLPALRSTLRSTASAVCLRPAEYRFLCGGQATSFAATGGSAGSPGGIRRRCRQGHVAFSAGTFYGRLDHFAKFENWDDIPAADRRVIDRRFLDEFIARHRANVQRKMQRLPALRSTLRSTASAVCLRTGQAASFAVNADRPGEAENSLPNDTVLLLGEVEEMLDAATHIAVQPCDCRRLGQFCDRPVGTCITLDSAALQLLDRGHGQALTREEAKELVRWADQKGLMHTADSEWQTRGLHAICNCCACDCYPFRAARELGSKGAWPRSRYVAVHNAALCNLCGACVKRCHFDAFYHDGAAIGADEREKPNVSFDADRCWGCGLCANTCPSGAIAMVSCGAEPAREASLSAGPRGLSSNVRCEG